MTRVGGYFTVQSSDWAPVKGTCGWLRGSIQGGAFSLHSFVSLMYVDLYFASLLHCLSVHSPWWDSGLIMSFWKREHNQHRYLVSVMSFLARTVSIFVAFQDHFFPTMPMAVTAPCFPPPPITAAPVPTWACKEKNKWMNEWRTWTTEGGRLVSHL